MIALPQNQYAEMGLVMEVKIVVVAQSIVIYVRQHVGIVYAKQGKIVHHAHLIAVIALPQIQYVGMGLVMEVNHVLAVHKIVEHALLRVMMVSVTAMRHVVLALKTVEHVIHYVEMDLVMVTRHVIIVGKTVAIVS